MKTKLLKGPCDGIEIEVRDSDWELRLPILTTFKNNVKRQCYYRYVYDGVINRYVFDEQHDPYELRRV